MRKLALTIGLLAAALAVTAVTNGQATAPGKKKWSTTVDVEYVGQHGWNMPAAVNINAVDFGLAFQDQYQDPTLAANSTPGATAVVTDLMRAYRGYGSISRRMSATR